jgi:hypothetical protein
VEIARPAPGAEVRARLDSHELIYDAMAAGDYEALLTSRAALIDDRLRELARPGALARSPAGKGAHA